MFADARASGAWSFRVALVCSGCLTGLTLTHVLQAPGSRTLTGGEWLGVQHTFYGGFAVVGGMLEVVGLLSAVTVALTYRRGRVTFASAFAAVAFAVTLIAYFAGNAPVNALVAEWTPATLPDDWPSYRDSWETAHAVSAVVSGAAFVALVIAAVPHRGAAPGVTTRDGQSDAKR